MPSSVHISLLLYLGSWPYVLFALDLIKHPFGHWFLLRFRILVFLFFPDLVPYDLVQYDGSNDNLDWRMDLRYLCFVCIIK